MTLTEAGRAAWATRTTPAAASEKIAAQSTKWMVIGRLLDGVETLLKDLAKEYGKPKAAAVVRELERVGYVRVGRRRVEATVKARHQQAVRLLPPSPEKAVSNERPLSAAQERLLERLRGLAEPPALAELRRGAWLLCSSRIVGPTPLRLARPRSRERSRTIGSAAACAAAACSGRPSAANARWQRSHPRRDC